MLSSAARGFIPAGSATVSHPHLKCRVFSRVLSFSQAAKEHAEGRCVILLFHGCQHFLPSVLTEPVFIASPKGRDGPGCQPCILTWRKGNVARYNLPSEPNPSICGGCVLKTDYYPNKRYPPMEDAKGKQELFEIDYLVNLRTAGY